MKETTFYEAVSAIAKFIEQADRLGCEEEKAKEEHKQGADNQSYQPAAKTQSKG